jgi:1-deoxy-D-xylulose-5-phosphate synthase
MAKENNGSYKYLYKINSPADLRKLKLNELQDVCREVREYMVDVITKTGGHFGAGLGVIELTVALHYVYNTPQDKIIFDVGHQGYPHKILTGRRDLLPTIRHKDGLSGFLKPGESEYDVFGAGHASTSISAALGIATARDMMNKIFRVVAIIGDGAMTGGMSYEAMNNCGVQKRDITVILNDNNISISENVSALSNYFNKLYATATVQKLRENIWELTGRMEQLGDRIRLAASRIEGSVKAFITPGLLFEALGFNYFGPVHGNNVRQLVNTLNSIKDVHGPVLLHVLTQKGKGYGPAENDSYRLHAIGKIDKTTGKSLKAVQSSPVPTYSQVFGEAMTELCRSNPKVVAITAAMTDGTGLDILERKFPDRVFDVGIAEEHGVTFAAGLAKEGMIPVCAIYSTFLQRAFDQVIHDCSIQKLHVVFAIDRAGLVGEDGATHHGILDMAYLRPIPNMIVAAPKDEQELRDLLFSAIYNYTNGPVAIRYPRGKALGVKQNVMKYIPLGKGEIVKEGKDIAIIAIGKMVNESVKASDILLKYDISAEVINARFVKPLDTNLLDDICLRFDKIITVEDGQAIGGFGSAVMEYVGTHHKNVEVLIHGIPDRFMEHGTQDELLHELKLDAEGIASKVTEMIGISEELIESYVSK